MKLRQLRQQEEIALAKPAKVYSKDASEMPSFAKFCIDTEKAAAKVGPRATTQDEFMRLLRLELIAMGYDEFA